MLLRHRVVVTLCVLFGVIAFSVLDHVGGILPVHDDWHRYHGQRFTVVRVIDGDTLDIAVRQGQPPTRVRLWGVDAPEIAHEPGEESERGGQEATDYLRAMAQGVDVTLRLQDHRLRGRYGRLLAYVELPDGTVLNERLIERGYAKADDRWGHDRFEHYQALQLRAKRNGLGVWSKPVKPK